MSSYLLLHHFACFLKWFFWNASKGRDVENIFDRISQDSRAKGAAALCESIAIDMRTLLHGPLRMGGQGKRGRSEPDIVAGTQAVGMSQWQPTKRCIPIGRSCIHTNTERVYGFYCVCWSICVNWLGKQLESSNICEKLVECARHVLASVQNVRSFNVLGFRYYFDPFSYIV